MKIGLVTSYMAPHLGGIEQIAENLFTGYEKSGVEVRWVASRVPAHLPRKDGPRVRVRCFNLVEDLLGVPVPLWGLEGWREVEGLARWADVLHVLECLYMSSATAVLLARRHGKPVLVSQNIGFVQYQFPPLNWLESLAYATLGRAVLRRASHVVLATPTAAGYVTELFGCALPCSSAFPIGIDTARFRPAAPEERTSARRRIDFASDKHLVLFAGRLVEKKGVPIVIGVAQRLPQVQFVVAGDGPVRSLLGRAPDNLAWQQAVAPAQMQDYYHAADCVLLPSHGEGLPLVIQEAMACGLPVVISEGEPYAGALIGARVCAAASRTADAMAQRVGEILAAADPSLGARARAYAEEHWSVGTMVARYVALFEALLATKAASAAANS